MLSLPCSAPPTKAPRPQNHGRADGNLRGPWQAPREQAARDRRGRDEWLPGEAGARANVTPGAFPRPFSSFLHSVGHGAWGAPAWGLRYLEGLAWGEEFSSLCRSPLSVPVLTDAAASQRRKTCCQWSVHLPCGPPLHFGALETPPRWTRHSSACITVRSGDADHPWRRELSNATPLRKQRQGGFSRAALPTPPKTNY